MMALVALRLRNPFEDYRMEWLRGGLLGALTAIAIVVPEGVAYAEMSGVPPQCAFYAAPVVLMVYALFGSGRYLVVATTAPAAVLTSAAVTGVSTDPARAPGLAAALAVAAGGVLLATGLARCGFVADFLAPPVLVGFLAALSLVIMVRQGPHIVGIHGSDGDFFLKLYHVLVSLPEWHWASIEVGLTALALLLALERWWPRIPSTLVVLVLGIGAAYAFGARQHGVAVVGRIPRALPWLRLPHVGAGDWWSLAGNSLGLALIVFTVSFSVAQRLDTDGRATAYPRKPDGSSANTWRSLGPAPDQEMAALGLAKLAAGLVGGFAVSGSPSASPAQQEAGGRSPAVGLFAAAGVVLIAAFCTPVFSQLPEPVLAAIILAAVRGFALSGIVALRRYWAESKTTWSIAVTALLGVLVFELLPGLLIAAALSFVVFVWQAGQLTVSRLVRGPSDTGFVVQGTYEGAPPMPGVVLLRPDGPLFFGNARRLHAGVREAVVAATGVRVAVLDLSASYRLPLPVLDTLEDLREELRRQGIELWLTWVNPPASKSIATTPLADLPCPASPSSALAAFAGR
jgi:SulP family sulfate permease